MQNKIGGKLANRLDNLLGLSQLNHLLYEATGQRNPFRFLRRALNVVIDDQSNFASHLPKSGPTLVVANHSYGALDAFVLTEKCLLERPDTLLFGNASLDHPCFRDWLLPLEIMDKSTAAKQNNLRTLRNALSHLKRGGCVVAFPAGKVESWRWRSCKVEEGGWSQHFTRLTQKSRATLVPVAFPKGNPIWVSLIGALHPKIRYFALLRVIFAAGVRVVPVKTGKSISYQELPNDSLVATQKIRGLVLRLAKSSKSSS